MNALGFKKGDKIYLDSFAGLVPAIVVEVKGELPQSARFSNSWVPGGEVKVRITGTRGAYKKGEVSWHDARYVVKREWVHRRPYGQSVIIEPSSK